MIKEDDSLIYIVNEKGKEEPYRILKEFENPINHKHFIFYISIEDDAEDVFVGEIVPSSNDGKNEAGDIKEVESDEDMKYCEEIFEEFQNEMDAIEESSEELDEDSSNDIIN